jgi:hypothetical protein
MSKIKTVISHASGWSGAKSAVREVRIAALLPVGLFKWIYNFYLEAKRAAAEDRLLAEQDSDRLWDLMVVEFGITTESVRKKYRIASLVNALLVLSLAAVIGHVLGNLELGTVFIFANAVFINLILMALFQNAYRLNMAYSQSAPPVGQFFKSLLRRPILLIARPLPPGYVVRGEK